MLPQLKNSLLLRNTLWMFVGQGIRIVLQAAYFIIVARTLGAEGYGLFIGVVTLVAILAPFSSLGRGELLVKNVSRNRDEFHEYWGNALVMTAISGILLTGLTCLLGTYLLPASVDPVLILWVALSDLVFYRVIDISGQSYQAVQQLKRTAQIQVLLGVIRLASALVLAFVSSSQSAMEWGFLYFLSTFFTTVAALILVIRELGLPRLRFEKLASEWKEGVYFSISLSSLVIYSDIGKTILVKVGTLEASGIFAAASRILDVTLTPLYSLMSATYARFFQEGQQGIASSMRFAKRLMSYSLVYAIVAALGLVLFAPVVPIILGDDYRFAVDAIRWMAIVPLFKAVKSFAADALTGAGYQGRRTGIQVAVAGIVICLNLWLIPLYSWMGAVIVMIASDLLLAACYLVMIWQLIRREQTLRISGQM